MDQKKVFLEGEGDSYFRRNLPDLLRLHALAIDNPESDPVLKAIAPLRPSNCLEIGAANGWRLDAVNHHWNSRCVGIEPSKEAVADGRDRYPNVTLAVGTADRLTQDRFDCVIFGFCLYMCDGGDLFKIASEADRVLLPGGHLVIFDFLPDASHSREYSHRKGMTTHKMDYSSMWSWHTAYKQVKQIITAHEGADPSNPDERLAVTLLRKCSQTQ